jgi:hypothetical protein
MIPSYSIAAGFSILLNMAYALNLNATPTSLCETSTVPCFSLQTTFWLKNLGSTLFN